MALSLCLSLSACLFVSLPVSFSLSLFAQTKANRAHEQPTRSTFISRPRIIRWILILQYYSFWRAENDKYALCLFAKITCLLTLSSSIRKHKPFRSEHLCSLPRPLSKQSKHWNSIFVLRRNLGSDLWLPLAGGRQPGFPEKAITDFLTY